MYPRERVTWGDFFREGSRGIRSSTEKASLVSSRQHCFCPYLAFAYGDWRDFLGWSVNSKRGATVFRGSLAHSPESPMMIKRYGYWLAIAVGYIMFIFLLPLAFIAWLFHPTEETPAEIAEDAKQLEDEWWDAIA